MKIRAKSFRLLLEDGDPHRVFDDINAYIKDQYPLLSHAERKAFSEPIKAFAILARNYLKKAAPYENNTVQKPDDKSEQRSVSAVGSKEV